MPWTRIPTHGAAAIREGRSSCASADNSTPPDRSGYWRSRLLRVVPGRRVGTGRSKLGFDPCQLPGQFTGVPGPDVCLEHQRDPAAVPADRLARTFDDSHALL